MATTEPTAKYRVTANKSESVHEFYETAQEAADRVTYLLSNGFDYVHVMDTTLENELW